MGYRSVRSPLLHLDDASLIARNPELIHIVRLQFVVISGEKKDEKAKKRWYKQGIVCHALMNARPGGEKTGTFRTYKKGP